jgi:putative transposase
MEKRNRFNKEIMEGAERDYNAGMSIKELCAVHGISKSSFYYWLSKHGEAQPKLDDRIASLKSENTKLRQLLANRVLEIIFAEGKTTLGTRQLQRLLGLQNKDSESS